MSLVDHTPDRLPTPQEYADLYQFNLRHPSVMAVTVLRDAASVADDAEVQRCLAQQRWAYTPGQQQAHRDAIYVARRLS